MSQKSCFWSKWKIAKTTMMLTRQVDSDIQTIFLSRSISLTILFSLLSMRFFFHFPPFLLIDFHPPHLSTRDCFLVWPWTTSGTQIEQLCWHLSNTPKAWHNDGKSTQKQLHTGVVGVIFGKTKHAWTRKLSRLGLWVQYRKEWRKSL